MQRVAPPDADFAKYPRRGRFCGWVTAFATEDAHTPYSPQKCIYPILRWGGIIFAEIRGAGWHGAASALWSSYENHR